MELIALQIFLGVALFWSCFCRLLHTTHNTERELRWVVTLKAATSLFTALAPILPIIAPLDFHWRPWDTPDWVWLMFMASALLMQVICAPWWKDARSMKLFERHEL